MSRFTDATFRVTEQRQRGRVVVELTSPLVYEIGYLGSGWKLSAGVGFRTDYASVPVLPSWSPRWLLRLRDWIADKLARASVPHDLCRSNRKCPKLVGDLIFLEAMGVDKVPAVLRWLAFIVVLLNFTRD